MRDGANMVSALLLGGADVNATDVEVWEVSGNRCSPDSESICFVDGLYILVYPFYFFLFFFICKIIIITKKKDVIIYSFVQSYLLLLCTLAGPPTWM